MPILRSGRPKHKIEPDPTSRRPATEFFVFFLVFAAMMIVSRYLGTTGLATLVQEIVGRNAP